MTDEFPIPRVYPIIFILRTINASRVYPAAIVGRKFYSSQTSYAPIDHNHLNWRSTFLS